MPPSMKPPVVYRKTKEKEGIYDYQSFADHREISERFRKTLYYGKLPKTDRPSLPMTELAVELFSKAVGKAEGLGQIDMHYAASVSRNACMSPYSMILAIAYIERLKRKSPDYLRQVSSSDLFLVSMMVASKFLYDEGEDEEVFNEEWAKSANMETKEVNYLERKFLAAIDWNVFLGSDGFLEILQEMELKIARRKTKEHGSCTYTDLTILLENLRMLKCWHLLMNSFVKVIAVSFVAYSASILTILSAVIVGHQVQQQTVQMASHFRPSSVSLSPVISLGGDFESDPSNDSDLVIPCDVLSYLSDGECGGRLLAGIVSSACRDCSKAGLGAFKHSTRHHFRHSNSDNRLREQLAHRGSPSSTLLDLSWTPSVHNFHLATSERLSNDKRHICCRNSQLPSDFQTNSVNDPPLLSTSDSLSNASPLLITLPSYRLNPNVTEDPVTTLNSLLFARQWLFQKSLTTCIGPGLAAFR